MKLMLKFKKIPIAMMPYTEFKANEVITSDWALFLHGIKQTNSG